MADGSVINIRKVGDEHFHYYCSESGINYVSDGTGYQEISESDLQARRADARKKVQRRAGFTSSYPTTGEQKGVVILVEYQDVKFSVSTPLKAFDHMLNKEGYSENGGTGSARDWFMDNSCGQFKPQFDVFGPVTLSQKRSYYGSNDSSGDDLRPYEMVTEACSLLDNEINFADYDRDGDGIVDNVYIFYAGPGENLSCGEDDMVWPHSADIADYTNSIYKFDDVRINHYACSNEINDDDNMEGIGTFCHEFSHVLGLPDIYATNYSSAFTPGDWSVLDSGPYNNDSRTPPYYTAYERYSLGWLTPKEIGKPARHTLDEISTNQAYIITTQTENEFFLLENRQQKGWDQYIPGHGMLIWHIDYSEALWNTNTVNNRKSHQNIDIEEADNIQSDGTITGDPFPGTAGITSFTDDTEPSMCTWDGSRQNKPIADITERDGVITFVMNGGKAELEGVEALAATDVDATSFVANWAASEDDVEYLLSVYSTKVLPSGKVSYSYVDGFEKRNMGRVQSAIVEGLTAATDYCYSVRCYDPTTEMESVASNEINVRTADPTFDMMSPVAEEAEEISASGFKAVWQPMAEADSYLLTVYHKSFGTPDCDTVDFTGGISAMPAGWDTNSTLTYAMNSYCGESAPSLRFSNGDNYIMTPEYTDGASSFSFWHRGNNAKEGSELLIKVLYRNEWQEIARVAVDNTVGGTITTLADELPNDSRAVSISYSPVGSGSVAIDDIRVEHGGVTAIEQIEGYNSLNVGDVTEYQVTIPTDEDLYYRVSALSGETESLSSNEIRVKGVSGIAALTQDASSYSLYNLQGILISSGEMNTDYRLNATSGIYILRIGNKVYKIRTK
jgi:M6 family metalloprotease-like protein